jgi:hypothetical protein
MYRFDTNNTNGPGWDWGQLLVVRGASDTIAQVAFSYIEAYVKVRSAYGIGGTPIWSAWKTMGSNTNVADKASNYTITGNDAGQVIRSTGSAMTITLSNVLQVGDRIDFIQSGTGQITFSPSGVTLNSKSNNRKTAAQHSGATVVCVASGVYSLIGDLVA